MKRTLNVKLIGIVFGSIALCAVVVHFLHGFQVERNAYRLLERADEAFESKNYHKAENYYEQYLRVIPDQPDAVQKLVEVLDRIDYPGDRLRRVLLMEQVLRAKPNEHAFRMRLVHNLINVGRLGDASDQLTRLRDVWDDKAEILHMLGWCNEAKKDYLAAVRLFREAIKQDPKQIRSYALLAEVLHDRQNEPDEAAKVMDDLIRENPHDYSAHLARARFFRQRGDQKQSDRSITAALKIAPKEPSVILAAADAARAKGEWEVALGLLNDGLKRYPDQARFYEQLANVNLMKGDSVAAMDSLYAGLKQLPKANELAVLLIDLMIDKNQIKEAQEKIDALRVKFARSALPNYLQARIHVAQKQWPEAIRLLEEVGRDLGPQSEWSSRVHALLGLSHRQMGDREQELLSFRRAVAEDPTWGTANIGLAVALLDNGRSDEACQVLEPMRNLASPPAGYWIWVTRARLQNQLRMRAANRRWDIVEEALAQADATEPPSAELALVRAEYLLEKGDADGAKATLEKAQTSFPQEAAVSCARADLASRMGRFDEAESILDQALRSKQAANPIELRLAQCRLWLKRSSASDRSKLKRLADDELTTFSTGDRARLGFALAAAWYRLNDLEKAADRWREIAKILPKDLRSRSWLLDLELQRGQPAVARQWVEELRRIEGESGVYWRYGDCAILIHEAHGRRANLDEARRKLQEIDRLYKNWPRAAALAGSIAEMEGNYLQAIREYSRALDQGEAQPGVLARLLEILIHRREFGKAEIEVTKYEQKHPLTPELARLGADVALGSRDKLSAKTALRRAELAVATPIRDYREALWLASICLAAGESARAESMLTTALDLAGHAPDVWIAWLAYLAQTNQADRASQEIDRMEKFLNKHRVALTRARCYDAMRQFDQAGSAYRAAVAGAGDDPTVLAFAADFFRRADLDSEARRLYERLVDPALFAPAEITVTARRNLAVLLAKSGNTDDRDRALALMNDNRSLRGDTLPDLRVRLFIQGQQAERRRDAIHQFQETNRRQTPSADERLLLAELLVADRHLGQARNLLSDLFEEDPRNTRYVARFAQVLIGLEEFAEARRMLAILTQAEPTSARTHAVQSALAKGEKEAAAKAKKS